MKAVLSNSTIRRTLLPVVTLGATLTACTDTAAPDPLLLEIVAGDGQEAQVTTELADSLVVRVTSLDGSPREGMAVSWTVWLGSGTVEPKSAFSDAEGLAKACWILGPGYGLQAVSVSAPGTDTLFQAWATPPPPSDWRDVLELRPDVSVQGDSLFAGVLIRFGWPGTIFMKSRKSCLATPYYPALYSSTGERLAYPLWGCWTHPTYHIITPGDSLIREWGLGIPNIEPGEYTLRYRFDVFEINGTPATLPEIEMPVTIGG